MTAYFVIDHPARRILVRRTSPSAVPERLGADGSTWTARTELLAYFVDGADPGIRPAAAAEVRELERGTFSSSAKTDPPSQLRDDRPRFRRVSRG